MCVCGPKKRGGDGQGKSSGVIEWSWIGEGGGERQTGRIGGGGEEWWRSDGRYWRTGRVSGLKRGRNSVQKSYIGNVPTKSYIAKVLRHRHCHISGMTKYIEFHRIQVLLSDKKNNHGVKGFNESIQNLFANFT